MRRFTLVFLTLLAVSSLAACSRENASSKTVVETVAVRQETYAEEQLESDPGAAAVSGWAGSMEAGFTDGENSSARFLKPYGLCQAPDGGLLIVDSYANMLRESDSSKVSGIAGSAEVVNENGLPLGGCLNGNAQEALLNHPRFAVTSDEGAVVFSDTDNHCIRVVKDGVVRLLAGEGTAGYQDGSYETARFHTPSGVAIGSSGVVYVADTVNHCIRQISSEGMVSVLAGVPEHAGFRDGDREAALFCEPNDIQLGPDGALYVVDKGNQRIRRIAEGMVTTVAGSGEDTDTSTGYMIGGYEDGPALSARFQYPTGLFVTDDGTIYVADTGNHCIRSVSSDGMVATVAGTRMPGHENGLAKNARFNQPVDVFYREGCLYVSDSYNHAVRLVSLCQ